MRRWTIIALAFAAAACSAPEITERYVAERAIFRVERHLRNLRDEGEPADPRRLAELAIDFESVALAVPDRGSDALREIEARAWMRAAECHFDLVDSLRAEFILANVAANFADLPHIFGEVSYQLGRVTERHGQYRATIGHYRDVIELVAPDPGPDPRSPPDPEARPEEKTADDFVLGLPLYIARLAVRDTTVTDAVPFYEAARLYYSDRTDDTSPFVRIESAVLLAEVLADRGEWDQASTTLDLIEDRIPGIVMTRVEPADVRLASFEYQVRARRFGVATADSVRWLLERLINDYSYGDTAPSALLAMANCAYELGEGKEAHHDLARLVRDYPTAPAVPEGQLLRARLYADGQSWRDARRVLQALPLEFPTSDAALRAPLEIAAYYRGIGDFEGERNALVRAAERYREILHRYPRGPHTFTTRGNLVTVFDLQGRYAEAVDELIAICDETALPAQRPGLLFAAARRAETHLADPARAAGIMDRLADEFPDTRLGRAAVRDARRLRLAQEQ